MSQTIAAFVEAHPGCEINELIAAFQPPNPVSFRSKVARAVMYGKIGVVKSQYRNKYYGKPGEK
jgi:hypothetical protein